MLIAAAGGFFAVGLQHEFTLAALRAHRFALADLCQAHPVLAPLSYFALYVAITALTLPLNVPLSLGAGALFGLAEGLVVVSFASAFGATLSMLSSRFLLRDVVRAQFGDRLAQLEAGLARGGMFYLLALRLAPMVPYSVVNMLFGLTAFPAWRFAAITQLGTLPTLLVFVNAGVLLDTVDTFSGVLSPGLIATFLLLAVLPLLTRVALTRWMPRSRKL